MYFLFIVYGLLVQRPPCSCSIGLHMATGPRCNNSETIWMHACVVLQLSFAWKVSHHIPVGHELHDKLALAVWSVRCIQCQCMLCKLSHCWRTACQNGFGSLWRRKANECNCSIASQFHTTKLKARKAAAGTHPDATPSDALSLQVLGSWFTNCLTDSWHLPQNEVLEGDYRKGIWGYACSL